MWNESEGDNVEYMGPALTQTSLCIIAMSDYNVRI